MSICITIFIPSHALDLENVTIIPNLFHIIPIFHLLYKIINNESTELSLNKRKRKELHSLSIKVTNEEKQRILTKIQRVFLVRSLSTITFEICEIVRCRDYIFFS